MKVVQKLSSILIVGFSTAPSTVILNNNEYSFLNNRLDARPDLPVPPKNIFNLNEPSSFLLYLGWAQQCYSPWVDKGIKTNLISATIEDSNLSNWMTFDDTGYFKQTKINHVDTKLIFNSRTELKNDTEQTQTLYSKEFNHEISDDYTVSWNNNFKYNWKIKGIFAESQIEINLGISTSTTKTVTTSVTAPRQPVIVPPYSTRYVDYNVFKDRTYVSGILSSKHANVSSQKKHVLFKYRYKSTSGTIENAYFILTDGYTDQWVHQASLKTLCYYLSQWYNKEETIKFLEDKTHPFSVDFNKNNEVSINIPVNYTSDAGRLIVRVHS